MAEIQHQRTQDTAEEPLEKPNHKINFHSLGHVRLLHHDTKEVILIPPPSADPNDPLNW